MEKLTKARKEYICQICHGVIRKGQKYIDIKLRVATYDKEFNYQDGIKYLAFKEHVECMTAPYVLMHDKETLKKIWKNCIFDNHKWINEVEQGLFFLSDGEITETGRVVCEYCRIEKPKHKTK